MELNNNNVSTNNVAETQAQITFKSRYLFEVAWEVVNKVGGIYTVIRSKANVSSKEFGDHYFLMGTINETSVNSEVDLCKPEIGHIQNTLQKLRNNGHRILFGRWLIEGYPFVILFDVARSMHRLAEFKSKLWNVASIGIPDDDHETNFYVVFGGLVSEFLLEFQKNVEISKKSEPVLAHFHEWQAGVGLLLTRFQNQKIATIFTTHATILGRYLSSSSADLYHHLPFFNCDKEAGDRKIYHRYCLERACANSAHIFTTVSKVTGTECEHMLKKKPDVITPNGLHIVKSTVHELQNRHATAKMKLHNFIQGHFYGHYDFDLNKTLYFFIAGRYEFHNKGGDFFIEALARLNHKLKILRSDVTVVAFIIFPAPNSGFNVESFHSQAIVKQLRDTVNVVQNDIGHRLFETCLRGSIPKSDDVLKESDLVRLKHCVFSAQRQTLPTICTHNMVDSTTDLVLSNLRRCNLFNQRSDRVKVIFHPEFLKATNPLIPMEYEEFVCGCHLGVFPSFYEPWGYTPAECVLNGVPNITTNVSGFGSFIETHVENYQGHGVFIVDRIHKSSEESIRQLSNIMFNFTNLTQRQRVILRNRTERLNDILDWENLNSYYQKARKMAMRKVFPELMTHLDSEEDKVSEKSLHVVSGTHSPRTSMFATPDYTESELSDYYFDLNANSIGENNNNNNDNDN